MRTERKKQHLLANYYRRPIQELVVPLQCCWRWTPQYLPLHWKTWSSTLIWQFQILKIEEHTVSASPQYRSEAYFQHTQSTANRADWHETVYFHISTVDLTEERSEEFSQFKVVASSFIVITVTHHQVPPPSVATCSLGPINTATGSSDLFNLPLYFSLQGSNFSFPLLQEKHVSAYFNQRHIHRY